VGGTVRFGERDYLRDWRDQCAGRLRRVCCRTVSVLTLSTAALAMFAALADFCHRATLGSIL
jgi:hypothetical protein